MALRVDDVDLERDRALVRRFQSGDEEAFDELYRRYHDRLERFCRKRVGDQYTAEELTQEAFTRALTALPELGGDLRFYPWVSVIAARLCVDSHRRESWFEPASDPDPGPVAGGQEDIVDAVDASLVATALSRLVPRHQDVLHLREVEGWSYQRIADHYGVKVGTVETLLFRARRALRREFHLVDGAGLVAFPLLGRLIHMTVRVRNRMPSWVPSLPSPSTVAAAATATMAAVALAVAPSPRSVPPATPPPASKTQAQAPVHLGSGGQAGPAPVSIDASAPNASTASVSSPATSAAAASAAVSPPPAPDGLSSPRAGTADLTPPSSVGAMPGTPANAAGVPSSSASSPMTSPLAIPSTDAVANVVPALPALPLPTLSLPAQSIPSLPLPALPAPAVPAPTSDLPTIAGPALDPAHNTLSPVLGGLLPGH